MKEELTRAVQNLDLVRDDLRAALKKATEVEAMLLYPMLHAIHDLTLDVAAFAQARETDQKEAAKAVQP